MLQGVVVDFGRMMVAVGVPLRREEAVVVVGNFVPRQSSSSGRTGPAGSPCWGRNGCGDDNISSAYLHHISCG